ncbi:unnamed protein product [Cylicostephanus goldi]|uniref:Uncharacterized protein n=1 Tax=Cylicostephanus goldi TaxID=71465 RepID=A0A3P6RW78_CYLGO|nr:unnamed protein product [Cylicostephanus goldi]
MCFITVLTPKSEALIRRRAGRDLKTSSNRRRVSEPLTQNPSSLWKGLTVERDPFNPGELFEPAGIRRENFVGGGAQFISFDQCFRATTPESISNDPVSCESDAEILSKEVIESLFSGIALTPPGTDPKDRSSTFWKPEQSKAARSLYMDQWNTPEYSPKHLPSALGVENVASKGDGSEKAVPISDAPAQSTSYSSAPDLPKNLCGDAADSDSDEKDSWENLDDTKLEQQVKALKLEVAAKAAKPRINYFAPPIVTHSSSWDPSFLGHVLEAYDIPEYKLAEDVTNALASTDWGNAVVKWLERKLVFVVFASERQAKDALVLHKHQWLRLRPLSKSPAHVQEKAKEIQGQLRPARARPKTNAVVARRMVEHTLGLRSSISKEQREAERKQLSDARGMIAMPCSLQATANIVWYHVIPFRVRTCHLSAERQMFSNTYMLI